MKRTVACLGGLATASLLLLLVLLVAPDGRGAHWLLSGAAVAVGIAIATIIRTRTHSVSHALAWSFIAGVLLPQSEISRRLLTALPAGGAEPLQALVEGGDAFLVAIGLLLCGTGLLAVAERSARRAVHPGDLALPGTHPLVRRGSYR